MTDQDIKGVALVAKEVHHSLPEDDSVFAERARLFPEGCLVLVDGEQVCGYAISHPIRYGQPPALNSLLGEIAPEADQYYIHDIAIVPKLRRRGLALQCISSLLSVAKRYPTTSLVSVYSTLPFWGRFGFAPAPADPALSDKLGGYGEDATYLLRRNDQ